MNSAVERLEIAEKVKANGAVYEGDLTKSITHLISFRTEGAKYKAAKSWGIKIVSIEWLLESLERGMLLDEKLYDPALPKDDRGKDAWDRTKPKRTSLGKRQREDSMASMDGGKRKLRRTASTKLSTQNEQIWGDIVGGGGNATPQVNRSGQWGGDANESAVSQQPKSKKPEGHQRGLSMQSTIENPPALKGIFSGCRFHLHGFSQQKSDVLYGHLVSNGAEVSNTVERLPEVSQQPQVNRLLMIVPHDMRSADVPSLPESHLPIETVTLWWVERCLHHKKFLDPNDHVIGRPFPAFPIDGFSGMTISSSAFSGIDLLHFQKAVDLIGAKYSEDMTPESSVLVTKTLVGLRKDKFDHAQEWKVPIVNADWIWESISAGTKLSATKYRCRSQKRTGSLPNTGDARVSKPAQRAEQLQSEFVKPVARTSSSSRPNAKLLRRSGIDDTAFAADEPSKVPAMVPLGKPTQSPAEENAEQVEDAAVEDFLEQDAEHSPLEAPKSEETQEPALKEESHTQGFPSIPEPSTAASDTHSYKTEPLSERSINSPTKTVSTAPAPNHLEPREQEEMNNAVSALLSSSKAAPAKADASAPRKRGPSRILGRATSNISTGSMNRSRATSVDSTATHGNAVEYPPYSKDAGAAKTANERIEMLMNKDKPAEQEDSQPPATQLQYDDPDSTEARNIVMAKMMGEKIENRRSGLKEKAVTLGSYKEAPRTTRRAARGVR